MVHKVSNLAQEVFPEEHGHRVTLQLGAGVRGQRLRLGRVHALTQLMVVPLDPKPPKLRQEDEGEGASSAQHLCRNAKHSEWPIERCCCEGTVRTAGGKGIDLKMKSVSIPHGHLDTECSPPQSGKISRNKKDLFVCSSSKTQNNQMVQLYNPQGQRARIN